MPARLCIVGSVNMDTFVSTPRIPAAGETILGGDVLRCVGGKGANQAVAARRVGAETSFVGAVGDDADGVTAMHVLTHAGVECQHLRHIEGAATASALVTVAATGENAIIVCPGANHAMQADWVRAAREQIMHADAVLLQLELPPAITLAAMEVASSCGTPVILNAAPIPDDLAPVMPAIERCDVLIVNEVEAASLLRGRSSLATLGPELVIITRGGEGLTYLVKGVEYRVPAALLPADMGVIDTVGAGDAFVGVFATRWAELRSGGALDDSGLRDAMYWGAAAGALACTKRGAIPSMPDRSDIVKLLQLQ